jgi:hypothetical protein
MSLKERAGAYGGLANVKLDRVYLHINLSVRSGVRKYCSLLHDLVTLMSSSRGCLLYWKLRRV